METKEIIKELRKQKNLSAKEVAEGCEMSVGVYQKYESGERNLGVPALKALADFYNVSTDYLLGRTEIKAMAGTTPAEQLDVSAVEKRIIERYTQLDENMRAVCVEVFRQLTGAAFPGENEKPDIIVYSRMHRMKASAGAGYDLDNEDNWRDIRIYDCPEAETADFAVEVDGDSMEPDYHDGEIVFIRLADEVPVGAVGLFIHEGKGYIKERGEKCLISRNPEYENICGECKTVGLAIGKAEIAP